MTTRFLDSLPVRVCVDTDDCQPAHDLIRVLVIEDDVHALRTISSMLRGIGFDAVQANNPVAALLELKNAKPDAVLLNLRFSSRLGISIADAMRRDPVFDDTAIVGMDRCADADFRERALQHCNGFIAKPFTADEVGREILAALAAQARARRERSTMREFPRRSITPTRSADKVVWV